ncbi:MAG: hypothetical protein IJU77_09575 [Butyrivibrio sp.]|nr:hypothetical protein [Butyrivibrio sp.]
MLSKVIREKQDMTYLKWSHIRNSSGTAGTFLKSESSIGGRKKYYKLSNFDFEKGVIGHECINEIIVDRMLTLLKVDHLSYELINAEIEIEGRRYNTYLCGSYDFKKRGESKVALDDYYRTNSERGESHYDFCVRQGFLNYIEQMIAVDFIILNRDRHGANIEVLRDARAHTLRLAPLFDHGLSLLYSCLSEETAMSFDIMEDKKCQNFIGSSSCKENLKLIRDVRDVFEGELKESDRDKLFEGLEGIMPDVFYDMIWSMIYERYKNLLDM